MKNIVFFVATESFGLSSHNTVSNGADNGANNCGARFMQASMRHGTTVQAVDNLVNRLNGQPKDVTIFGHGNNGLVETGAGQNGWSTDTVMYRWNQFHWEPLISKLKPFQFGMLSIYSCYTGAGEEGSEFLFQLAKAIDKPARARTGLTYCGSRGISFQAGSKWQTATPNHKPEPIPKPFLFSDKQISDVMIFIDGKDEIDVSVQEIDSIEIVEYYGSQHKTPFTISKPNVEVLARYIFEAIDINIDGDLMAMKTGMVEMKTSNSILKTIIFEIYGDNVLHDTSSKKYYYLNNGLSSFFRSI